MKRKESNFLNIIAQAIYDKKGSNILGLDLRGVSNLCDYMIIAEGSVDRHVNAIAENVIDEMKKEKRRPLHVEGMLEGKWVVVDYLDIIVHIFTPDFRAKYKIEKLWNKAKIVDLKINTGINDDR